MEKEPIDTSNPKQIKERKTKAKLTKERDIAELHELLQTYGGRAFIWRILCECGMYKTGITHPQETFRDLGKRDIGLWVVDEVFTSDPDAYTVMRVEAVSRDTKD